MLKKFLLSFLSAILLLVSLARYITPARAQEWYNPSFNEFTDRVFDDSNPEEIFGERYTFAQVTWIIHSLTAIFVPDIILACFAGAEGPGVGTCIDELRSIIPGVDLGSNYLNQNLAQTINNLTGENRLSGVGYIRKGLSTLHLVPEAKAQGFGFENLDPIRSIWSAIRDVSYFLLIIAFIVMAFMIMFRVRISPQTIITVQSALPRLILILILITFSYAIAGFVVDLTYLAVGLLAIIGSNLSSLDTLSLFNVLITSLPVFTIFLIPLIAGLALLAAGFLPIPLVGQIFLLLGAVITFLIFIILAVIAIRIIWLFIKTFINVVLLIAASPLLILAGVFPAAGGFSTWLKNLLSHIMVFPAIIMMVFVAHFVFWTSLQAGPVGDILSGVTWLNPYQISVGSSGGSIELPGFHLGDSTVFGIIVAIGVLFMIPAVGNIIQGAISGRPFAYGTAIGQAFGPIGALYGSGPARELREQAGATTAVGLVSRLETSGRLPASWTRTNAKGEPIGWFAKFASRTRKRAGI